jgi:hypothetical protein
MIRELGKAVWGAQTREDMLEGLVKGKGILREWVDSHGTRSFIGGLVLGLAFVPLIRLFILSALVIAAVGAVRYFTRPHRTVVPT